MKKILISVIGIILSALVYAQDISIPETPKFTTYNYMGQSLLAMSDSGEWGLLFVPQETKASAKLVNLHTHEVTDLQTEAEIVKDGMFVVADVTDDGNIIVGSYKGYPAFHNVKEGTYTRLPSSNMAGQCSAVTPDGRYAVGAINDSPADSGEEVVWFNYEKAKMWDLSTVTEVEIPATLIPKKDPKGDDIKYMRYVAVSPDGRYLVARTLTYAEYFTILIDREEKTSQFLGFESNNGGKTYTPLVKNLYFIEPGGMSADGNWIVCNGYIVDPLSGGYGDEYNVPVRYNIQTGEIDALNVSDDDHDMFSVCIDNDGNVYGCTPPGSAIREFYIRSGEYWYSLRSVLWRKYGIDYTFQTALDNTGTPMCVSADGKTFISMVDPQYGENYCLQMFESLAEACAGMNLLGIYFLDPTEGSVMTKINRFKLTFDREVDVVGEQTSVRFGEWNSVSNNGIVIDPTDSRSVIITFRSRTLTDGVKYTLTIPAGTICIKGDETQVNDEITATYTGRADAPVTPSVIYPASGSSLAKLDNSSSPVILQFSYVVKLSDEASAALYTEENVRICQLQVSSNGNTVYITPSTTQYLFADVDYKVVLEAGSITDVSGNGGNQKLTIRYSGNYEREISHDETILFFDDFSMPASSLATWLLYDNDRREPVDAMKSMEYDAENTPWNFSILESYESTDFCAASHSMYKPAGQSDDWMVTPRLYIPDNLCTLTFDAQSYLNRKSDRLKVMVWECEAELKYIDADVFPYLQEESVEVLDVQLNPGSSEENLTGDWQTFTVDLAPYAGKYIYISFVNQNTDQSMVFVDNVLVNRNMNYLLSLKHKQSVVCEESIVIAGTLTANNAEATYTTLTLTLRDGAGEEVSQITETGLSLSKGTAYAFSFPQPLPLEIGVRNDFSIDIQLDDLNESITSHVKDLAFQPTKRVVLEEMTGTTCGNCPQGIIAIEHLKALYGDLFIPISIHTYDGDPMGAGLSAYSNQLGLRAAPSAIINRNSEIVYPMATDNRTNQLTLSDGKSLWMDVVAAEFDNETEVDVQAEIVANEADGTFTVPVTVRSALNAKNTNYNIFMVLLEDKIVSNQLNYLAGETDEVLGEWGQGGLYGKANATGVIHDDVVRTCYGPNIYGASGLLPQTMVAGEPYSTDAFQELSMPGTVVNPKNTKIAVILIDANTDRIINAFVVPFSDESSLDDICIDDPDYSHSDTSFSLSGIPVSASYRGIIIHRGKLILRQ